MDDRLRSAPLPEAPAVRVSEAPPDAPVLEHEYDGIREYDNPLPRWWVMIFWGSFVFSLGYYFYFHVLGVGESVEAGFRADERAAREQRLKLASTEKVSEESLAKLAADPMLVNDAKVLFGQRCAPCHGAEGQGLIGPNLTDGKWLHGGGKLMDIYKVIAQGVPAKGMPAWQAQLSPAELYKVTAFVGAQHGKNLPGKAPEGTPAAE
jgi:cytochrome c oxidase cbb3-type subunit 3